MGCCNYANESFQIQAKLPKTLGAYNPSVFQRIYIYIQIYVIIFIFSEVTHQRILLYNKLVIAWAITTPGNN